MLSPIQKLINKNTGVNRGKKNKISSKNAKNVFKRKSGGGMGG
ncbi:MAG: hypothetical protein RSD14_04975 [Clostridia bacterium]